LTSEVVVPAMGETVGVIVGGINVAVAMGAAVMGSVAVTNSGSGRTGVTGLASQPVHNSTILKKTLKYL